MYKINHANYMRRENTNTEIYRPYGSGDYIFIYFPVKMVHYMKSETVVTGENACVIYAPSDECRFTGFDEFINSYVHLSIYILDQYS